MKHYPIDRTIINDGWVVKAHIHSKIFLDVDYGGRQNSYLQALKYSEEKLNIRTRKHSVDRNITIVEKKDKSGLIKKYVRITRPMGGYKFFLIEINNGNLLVEKTIQEANNWFRSEREKCEEDIISRNTESRNKRQKEHHSVLFGDPTMGLKFIVTK